MQNRYFGDIVDFGKYGMLREVSKTGLKLGVNWYLYPDEDQNNDGKYTKYLACDKHNVEKCDPTLYYALKELLAYPRAVKLIETSGLLDALFYNEMHAEPLTNYQNRLQLRNEWFRKSLEVLSKAEIVFCDPDNGFEVPSVRHTEKKSGKYIYFDEMRQIYESGKSLIIYHHGPLWFKKGELQPYLMNIFTKINSLVAPDAIIFCTRWEITAKRFYFWVIHPEHKKFISACISDIKERWNGCFSFYTYGKLLYMLY